MRKRKKIFIRNTTQTPIYVCRRLNSGILLKPGEKSEFFKADYTSNFCHGHASIGNFIVDKHENNVAYKYWGKIRLTHEEHDDATILDIVPLETLDI